MREIWTCLYYSAILSKLLTSGYFWGSSELPLLVHQHTLCAMPAAEFDTDWQKTGKFIPLISKTWCNGGIQKYLQFKLMQGPTATLV